MNSTEKRILLIWPYFPPDTGAASVRGKSFNDYLIKKSYHTKVISIKHFNLNYPKNKVIRLPSMGLQSPAGILANLLRLIRVFISFKPQSAIVSIPSVFLGVLAILTSKLTSVRLVIDTRDLPLNLSYSSLKYWAWSFCFAHANKILTTSQGLKRLIIDDYKTNIDKVEVIPNGVSNNLLSQKKSVIKNIDVTFLGTLVPERNLEGIEQFLDTLFSLRSTTTVSFVGIDFENIFASEFVQKLKQKKYCQQLSFYPQFPQQKAFEIVVKSRIGLVSVKEGIAANYQVPAKVYEYLAAATVVACLAPRNAEITDFIKANNAGLWSSNPTRLAEETNKLLNDTNKIKKISLYNKENANNYLRSTSLEKLEKILNEKAD